MPWQRADASYPDGLDERHFLEGRSVFVEEPHWHDQITRRMKTLLQNFWSSKYNIDRHLYLACKLEILLGAVRCLNYAVAWVETGDEDHTKAVHVTRSCEHAFVLNLRGCEIQWNYHASVESLQTNIVQIWLGSFGHLCCPGIAWNFSIHVCYLFWNQILRLENIYIVGSSPECSNPANFQAPLAVT